VHTDNREGRSSFAPGQKQLKPKFFKDSEAFRAWLEKHHDSASELRVGFYKKGSKKQSITLPEAQEQALCFGWIDSVAGSLDAESYTVRFTPRREGSNWSAVNIKRVGELKKQRLMHPAGIKAFERRTAKRSGIYSYEQRDKAKLSSAQERKFRANKKAWTFFQSQSPSYRKTTIWWVVNAKREETRDRRLAALIQDSEKGRPIGPMAGRKAE